MNAANGVLSSICFQTLIPWKQTSICTRYIPSYFLKLERKALADEKSWPSLTTVPLPSLPQSGERKVNCALIQSIVSCPSPSYHNLGPLISDTNSHCLLNQTYWTIKLYIEVVIRIGFVFYTGVHSRLFCQWTTICVIFNSSGNHILTAQWTKMLNSMQHNRLVNSEVNMVRVRPVVTPPSYYSTCLVNSDCCKVLTVCCSKRETRKLQKLQ